MLLPDAEAAVAKVVSVAAIVVIRFSDQAIVYATPAAHKMFDYVESELHGMPLDTLIPERFRLAHAAHVNRYFSDRKDRMMGARGMTLVGLTRTGIEIPVAISLTQVMIRNYLCGLANVVRLLPENI